MVEQFFLLLNFDKVPCKKNTIRHNNQITQKNRHNNNKAFSNDARYITEQGNYTQLIKKSSANPYKQRGREY